MKLISFLTLVLFSALSLAGSLDNSISTTTVHSVGYSQSTGEAASSVIGKGTATFFIGSDYRKETFKRNDVTSSSSYGNARTVTDVISVSGSDGFMGFASSVGTSVTKGYGHSESNASNSIKGKYLEISHTGWVETAYESGKFENTSSSTNVANETYKASTVFNSDSVFAAW